VLAGHRYADGKIYFFLPRATSKVPQALLSRVFPEIDRQLDTIQRAATTASTSQREDLMAQQAFCHVLRYLRTVLLQDAPFILQQHPNHPALQSSLFMSSDFLEYARQVVGSVTTLSPPINFQIDAVVPTVAAEMRQLNAKSDLIAGRIQEVQETSAQHRREILQSLGEVRLGFERCDVMLRSGYI